MREPVVCLWIVRLPKIAGSTQNTPKTVQITAKGLFRKNDNTHLVFLSRHCTFQETPLVRDLTEPPPTVQHLK